MPHLPPPPHPRLILYRLFGHQFDFLYCHDFFPIGIANRLLCWTLIMQTTASNSPSVPVVVSVQMNYTGTEFPA